MKILSSFALIACFSLMTACGSTTEPESNVDNTEATDNQDETNNDQESTDSSTTDTTNTTDTTDNADTSDDTDTDSNSSGADNATPSETAELAALFEGSFAFKKTVTTLQEVPLMGSSESVTTGWGYSEITFDGTDLWLTEHGCHVEVSGMDAVSTEIPDAVPQSMEPVSLKLVVWKDGNTVQWERPEAAMLVGVTLDNPFTDELPSDPNDSRIFDQDGDGNPGVTVKVAGFISGDIYVVQRAINTYYGTLAADGSLTGHVIERGDQKTLGATNSMLEQDVPNEAINDPERNPVQLVRIEPSMTCELLMDSVDSIF